MLRNINNVFETRPIEVIDPLSKESILFARTITKAREYLKLPKNHLEGFINKERVVFSKKLNKGVLLVDYKEKWLEKRNIILVSQIGRSV